MLAITAFLARRRETAESVQLRDLRRELRESHLHAISLGARCREETTRADVAEQALAEFRQDIRAAHSRLVADNAQLRLENTALRRDRDSVRPQLDHALGYGAPELAAIEAGKTKAAAA